MVIVEAVGATDYSSFPECFAFLVDNFPMASFLLFLFMEVVFVSSDSGSRLRECFLFLVEYISSGRWYFMGYASLISDVTKLVKIHIRRMRI